VTHGSVIAVCIAPCKGERKRAVEKALLVANHGLDGDAHAGPWHRQVSLLAASDVDDMRDRGLELEPGDFGENLVVDGCGLDLLGIGSRLSVAEALLEITQIGKACHSRCAIYFQTGDCIMPRNGLFAKVVRGGEIRPGESIRVLRRVPRSLIQAAVVTVSDSASAGVARDTAGPAVSESISTGLGGHVAISAVVPDELDEIAARIVELADRGLDLVVTTGGTGCAERDRTPEATRSVIDREVPGLAEAMRAASAVITPHAWLQRGVCGIRGATLVVNLPGSRKAATENLTVILPVIEHAIELLRGHTRHHEYDDERKQDSGEKVGPEKSG
jgi:molybdenum cofactor synthesis domain-containing protein